MRTSVYTILVPSHSNVKTTASCVILLLYRFALCLGKGRNEEGEKASSLLPRCAVMRCNLIHSNENNDIITATIPPNIVAMKSSFVGESGQVVLVPVPTTLLKSPK